MREKDLIQAPFVSRWRTTAFQLVRVGLPKFQAPLPHRFVGQHNSTLGHEFFDVTETEGETEIEPDAVTDDC